MVGKKVKYNGKNRPHLTGIYTVIDEASNGAVQFDAGDGTGLQWCHKSALKVVPDTMRSAPLTSRDKLIAEIENTKKRLSELEAALIVIDSLS